MEKGSYKVKLFSRGFTRRKCDKCGEHFWTRGKQKLCGDTPCVEYGFIGKPPIKKMSLNQVRTSFIDFFDKNGHSPIDRYPIVARWREDVYFTIASIACFQPWVVNGTSNPPANPLVMSQPVLRFNDIDNVGKTGRHFTLFEMMAHHAFNKKGKQIYWKDKTVELCDKFFVGLGIKPADIIYKEAWWEGGGNAGPCFEVLVDGAEVATLVFMEYDGPLENGEYRKMPMTIVDTGYGLERICWLSHGTPTAYEAVFGKSIDYIAGLGKVSRGNKKIMTAYAKQAGVMNIDSAKDLKRLRSEVAKKMGIEKKELEAQMLPWEHIYTVADHSRALAFMIGDGVVPSNTKDGYFARLLVRRALRSMKYLGIKNSLADIVEHIIKEQAEFPELKRRTDTIKKIVRIEEQRFYETIERGKRMVERKVETLKERGTEEFPLIDLIELYDSQGLPPEEVKKFSSIPVNIPDNFYIKVAERHVSAQPEVGKSALEVAVEKFPETKKLYYDEPYLREAEAAVLGVLEGKYVILDRTLFYPEGGGQPADKGHIQGKEVLNVMKFGEVVVHELKSVANLPKKVSMELFWKRRFAMMQAHSATHLVNSAAVNLLGDHIWQAGAQKGEDKVRLDLTHYDKISPEMLAKIELEANRLITQNLPVKVQWMNREDAEKKYGFRLYQGGPVPGKKLRVITISDVEACGGTHVSKTGEIGLIKLLRAEKLQDGIVRLEYSVGDAAIKEIQKEVRILSEAAAAFSVTPEKLVDTSKRFFKEWSDRGKEIDRLYRELALARATELETTRKKLWKYKILFGSYPKSTIEELQKICEVVQGTRTGILLVGEHEDSVKVLVGFGEELVNIGMDANAIMKKVTKEIGGGGGGTAERATGGGPKKGDILEAILPMVRKELAGKRILLRLVSPFYRK